jgi:hypothetical protein
MDIFTGLGLAAPAGLNAYIPLLTVALADRFTDLIDLDSPWDFLSSDAGIAILVVLLLIELFADAVPGLDTVNDVIQTGIRPAAGAAVMLATGEGDVDTARVALAVVAALLAGAVHAIKTLGRPVVTASTAGIGNPVVSTIENVVAVVLSVLAILVPVLVVIGIVVLLVITARWVIRRRSRDQATGQ